MKEGPKELAGEELALRQEEQLVQGEVPPNASGPLEEVRILVFAAAAVEPCVLRELVGLQID